MHSLNRKVQMLLRPYRLLQQTTIMFFQLIQRNISSLQLALLLPLSIHVSNDIACPIRPNISPLPVFLPVAPQPIKPLPIRVVQSALSIAVVVLELAVVDLAVGPHEDTWAVFATVVEVAEVHPSIRVLVKAFTVHCVEFESALVYFAFGSDTTAEAIDLPLNKETFKHRVIWINLKPKSIRLTTTFIHLSAVQSA